LLFVVRALGFALLDAGEELAALRPPIVDKRLDVLLQTRHCLLHFRVELLGSAKSSYEVVEALVDPPVLGHDGVSLPREGFVLALL
jgi:hypothetical protein